MTEVNVDGLDIGVAGKIKIYQYLTRREDAIVQRRTSPEHTLPVHDRYPTACTLRRAPVRAVG